MKILRDQDFVIRNTPADPLGPYVDITDVDGTATTLDFYGNPYGSAYGYAVRRVKGASVAVRVLWNPSFFSITSDSATNMQALDRWGRDWRRTTVETFLQRGEN